MNVWHNPDSVTYPYKWDIFGDFQALWSSSTWKLKVRVTRVVKRALNHHLLCLRTTVKRSHLVMSNFHIGRKNRVACLKPWALLSSRKNWAISQGRLQLERSLAECSSVTQQPHRSFTSIIFSNSCGGIKITALVVAVLGNDDENATWKHGCCCCSFQTNGKKYQSPNPSWKIILSLLSRQIHRVDAQSFENNSFSLILQICQRASEASTCTCKYVLV